MGWRFAQLDEDEALGLEGEDAFDEPQPRRLFGMVDVGDDDVTVTRFGQPGGGGLRWADAQTLPVGDECAGQDTAVEGRKRGLASGVVHAGAGGTPA